jgi:predicted PurR-regulated permease PerM
VGDPSPQPPPGHFFERVVALALVASLVATAFTILAPFATVLLWSLFMTVTLWPLHVRLTHRLGDRPRLAASFSVAALFVALIVPVSLGVVAIVPGVRSAAATLSDPTRWAIPAPPAWVEQVPLAGQWVHGIWRMAAADVSRILETYKGDIALGAGWLLARVLSAGVTLLQLVLASVLTWPMLLGARRTAHLLQRFFLRVGGERSVGLLDQAARTIRSVSIGVIGTAILLAGMQALGLWLAGVPLVPLLGLASFVLATAQLGSHPVYLAVALWLALGGHTGRAAFTAVWGVVANSLIDTGLRPYLISHGTGLPLSVIFLGVTGGILAWGFVGVFLGPTLLGAAWTLLRGWLQEGGEQFHEVGTGPSHP